MSVAGKWIDKLRPVLHERPGMTFKSHDSDYAVVVQVSLLPKTGEPIMTLDANDKTQPVALRGPNALALAKWIVATFGEHRKS